MANSTTPWPDSPRNLERNGEGVPEDRRIAASISSPPEPISPTRSRYGIRRDGRGDATEERLDAAAEEPQRDRQTDDDEADDHRVLRRPLTVFALEVLEPRVISRPSAS